MAIQKIDIDTFLTKAPNAIVIDVRSPGEYEQAHIPGAYSLPLFTNEERAIVGTTYKKKSREAAIKIALPFFGYKMAAVIDQVEAWIKNIKKQNPENNPDIIVHCWRGGMRSGAIAWLLDLYGFKVSQLIGGYKGYRNWVLGVFEKQYAFKILGGYTGSGKTEILHSLMQQSVAVIDLEGIAHHKGSSFGALGQAVQPTQEMFENKLANKLFSIPAHTEIWMEDESQRIGTVLIPNSIFTQMRASVCYFIDIPFEERLGFIEKAYGVFDQQSLIDATLRIQKRLGGLETKNVIAALIEGETRNAFSILLKYYDRWYEKNNKGEKANFKFKVVSLPADKVDPLLNANMILATA